MVYFDGRLQQETAFVLSFYGYIVDPEALR